MNSKKIECTYGKKCYRLNPTHFIYNSHSHLEDLISRIDTSDEDNITIPDDYSSEISPSAVVKQIKVILSQRPRHASSSSTLSDAPSTSSQKRNDESPRKKVKLNHETTKSPKTADIDPSKVTHPLKYGDMGAKWLAAAPYHFFLTRIEDSKKTHKEDLSITFPDLYDSSLGELEASVQINFMIDIAFVMPPIISAGYRLKPLLLLYETSNVLRAKLPDNVKHREVKAKSAFGHHHTKMSLMYYKDKSLRVVVFTANLIPDDWKNYTQGVWMSPACPRLSDPNSSGESVSGFKATLKSYLSAYEIPELGDWIQRVKETDFSQVKVCLLTSVPSSGPSGINKWGLGQLRTLLRQHIPSGTTTADWPAIVQCSSIGSLGATPNEWLESQMKAAMLGSNSTAITKTPLSMIYPCRSDVLQSHDGVQGGGCLPYSRMTHVKQLWIREFMHRWRADSRHRSRATPHIKTYCRISPDTSKLAWFILTSANLSKAAWGRSTHQGSGQNIMSYEAGVLFLPKLLIGKNVFEIGSSGHQEGEKFPLPYDVPLTQYDQDDKPWITEYLTV